MEELKYNFESLKDRVWKTYKSRINAAERLKKNNEFIAFLSIYYAAVLAATSILNYVNKNSSMDVCNIVLSVMVTILFLHFDGRNYKERYINMRDNYNELSLLHYEIESDIATNNMDQENLKNITKKYTQLLKDIENHLERDYIKYALRDDKIQIYFQDKIKYYIFTICIWILKCIAFIIPTVILIIPFIELLC